ncbi:MAG: AlpA family phage regulatory protein [Deltaproteobacteria bacterium]|jgi:predicted DNA-binding transcriptional regulator AlpA|nr:AlpA family phage regulatory protein [Deltaproteobacteria bacterium]
MNNIDRLVPDRLIRAKQVAEITGLGLTTVYEHCRTGLLPAPVPYLGGRMAWSLVAINQWVEDRKNGIPLPSALPPQALPQGVYPTARRGRPRKVN